MSQPENWNSLDRVDSEGRIRDEDEPVGQLGDWDDTIGSGAAYEGTCPGCGKAARMAVFVDIDAVKVPNVIEVGCRCGVIVGLMVKGTATLTASVCGYRSSLGIGVAHA